MMITHLRTNQNGLPRNRDPALEMYIREVEKDTGNL